MSRLEGPGGADISAGLRGYTHHLLPNLCQELKRLMRLQISENLTRQGSLQILQSAKFVCKKCRA